MTMDGREEGKNREKSKGINEKKNVKIKKILTET
jgi:hypothetical protein